MQKRILAILVFVIIISVVSLSGCNHDRYYPEVTWEIISYEEIPQEIRDIFESDPKISDSDAVTGSVMGKGGESSYIILTPPENKSIEILSIEKSKNSVNSIEYKYKIIDRTEGNPFENYGVIKVNNFNGNYQGIYVSHSE